MEINLKNVPAITVISWPLRLTIPQIPAHSGPAIRGLNEAMKQLGIQPAGAMTYVYRGCDGNPAVEFDLDICLPIAQAGGGTKPAPPAEIRELPAFRCVAVDYIGPMSGIGQAWMNVVKQIQDNGYEPTAQSREIYKKWVDFESAENVTELQQGIK